MKNIIIVSSDIGDITIAEENGKISNLYFKGDQIPMDAVEKETAILKEAKHQLESYLAGRIRTFSLPLAPAGTPFMLSVFASLGRIPYGQTCSYGDIARDIGNPKACRAVGQANHRNSIPIFIPCHRVIGSDGSLTGYGSGLHIKSWLLELERKHDHL